MKNIIMKNIILVACLVFGNQLLATTCDTVCKYTTSKKYFITGVTDVTGYKWRTTGGLAMIGGQGSDSMDVNFTSATPGFDTIYVKAYNLCDTSAEVKFVVFVQDTLTKPMVSNDTAVCQGSPFTINVSGAAGATFNWTKPNATTLTGASISVATSSPSPDSGIYSVTQTVNGCVSQSSAKVLVKVYTKPAKATNTTDTARICETSTKTLTATPSGGTWSIVSGGGSIISGNTYKPDSSITADATITVRYRVDSNGVCPATTADTMFKVNFQDTARQQTDTARICETSTKTLLGTPAGGIWSVVSGGGSVTNPGGVYTPANITADATVKVRYTVAANGACPTKTADTSFVVNFIDSAKNTTDTTTIHELTTKSLTATPAGGTWIVMKGKGTISGAVFTPNVLLANDTVTVRYKVAKNGACDTTISDRTFIVLNLEVDPDRDSFAVLATGGTTPSVITNDSTNGSPTTLGASGNSKISNTGWPSGIVLDTTTGTISVAAGTNPIVYTLKYTVCDKLVPTSCKDDTVIVKVIPVIDPMRDTATRFASGGTIPNIAGNDSTNGKPSTLGATGNSTVKTLGTWPSNVTLNPTSGVVTIAAGTKPGTYKLPYELCDTLTPTPNCKTDTVELKIDAIIDPDRDSFVVAGNGDSTTSIIANDTTNGVKTTIGAGGNSKISQVGTWPTGIRLDTMTGKVYVDSGLLPDIFKLGYKLCDSFGNCKDDTVVISVRPLIFRDTIIAPTTCNATDGKIIVKTLLANTPYVVTYNASFAISRNLTSDAQGKISIDGLTAGTYTNIKVTTTDGRASNILAGPHIVKGPAPKLIAPVINCK